jgi:hypothetical protein
MSFTPPEPLRDARGKAIANTAVACSVGPSGQNVTLYYSYKTLVGFRVGSNPRVVHQNDWSTTTGKHLNAIDGGEKKSRVNDTDFERLLNEHMCGQVVPSTAPASRMTARSLCLT